MCPQRKNWERGVQATSDPNRKSDQRHFCVGRHTIPRYEHWCLIPCHSTILALAGVRALPLVGWFCCFFSHHIFPVRPPPKPPIRHFARSSGQAALALCTLHRALRSALCALHSAADCWPLHKTPSHSFFRCHFSSLPLLPLTPPFFFRSIPSSLPSFLPACSPPSSSLLLEVLHRELKTKKQKSHSLDRLTFFRFLRCAGKLHIFFRELFTRKEGAIETTQYKPTNDRPSIHPRRFASRLFSVHPTIDRYTIFFNRCTLFSRFSASPFVPSSFTSTDHQHNQSTLRKQSPASHARNPTGQRHKEHDQRRCSSSGRRKNGDSWSADQRTASFCASPCHVPALNKARPALKKAARRHRPSTSISSLAGLLFPGIGYPASPSSDASFD
jgi:hypothetical protein